MWPGSTQCLQQTQALCRQKDDFLRSRCPCSTIATLLSCIDTIHLQTLLKSLQRLSRNMQYQQPHRSQNCFPLHGRLHYTQERACDLYSLSTLDGKRPGITPSVQTCIHGEIQEAVPQRLAIVLPWPNAQAALCELIAQRLQLHLHAPLPSLLFTATEK